MGDNEPYAKSMIKPSYQKNQFPHWYTIPVRFRDLDPLNHANNALFSTYYEEARIAFIRKVPTFAQSLEKGFSFVLANIQIDFIRPVQFPANLLVGSGIKSLGNTSITSFQAIYIEKNKKLVSVSEASGVWFDVQKKQPARIPDFEQIDELTISFDKDG